MGEALEFKMGDICRDVDGGERVTAAEGKFTDAIDEGGKLECGEIQALVKSKIPDGFEILRKFDLSQVDAIDKGAVTHVDDGLRKLESREGQGLWSHQQSCHIPGVENVVQGVEVWVFRREGEGIKLRAVVEGEGIER